MSVNFVKKIFQSLYLSGLAKSDESTEVGSSFQKDRAAVGINGTSWSKMPAFFSGFIPLAESRGAGIVRPQAFFRAFNVPSVSWGFGL